MKARSHLSSQSTLLVSNNLERVFYKEMEPFELQHGYKPHRCSWDMFVWRVTADLEKSHKYQKMGAGLGENPIEQVGRLFKK